MRLRLTLFIVILLVAGGLLKAQNIEYGAELDTNYMMIGDQQHLTFKVRSDKGIKVDFPRLKDTIVSGVEIVSGPLRDSLKQKDGKWLYQEKYVITAFDTGVYVIPVFPIVVEGESYNNVLRTEPIGFAVNTYQVDEQKGNYDIVMPYDTPINFGEILPWLLGLLLVIALIIVGWWYWQYRKKNRPLFRHEKVVIPPFVKAIQSLDELKNEKLWQSGKIKEYYTCLTDTMRQYIEGELDISAMELTSFEIMQEVNKNRLMDAKDKENLSEMLEVADYVKFAKMSPLPNENARYLDVAYAILNNTNMRIKQEQEEIAAKQQKDEKVDNPE